MPNDYMTDDEAQEPTPDVENTQDESGKNPAEDEGETTALLPRSILMGKDFQPGDEIVLKIVRMHDDEVEVSYESESKDGHSEGEGEDEGIQAPPAADGGMASMME